MLLLKFFLLSALLAVITCCTDNCQCGEVIECYLKKCEDPLTYEGDIIIIHGKLCKKHRSQLKYADMYVTLIDDKCLGIPNCR